MPRITISYRRDDTLDITGRIFDRLERHCGREAVFRDIDSIPPGADFRRHIDRVLDESDIILAIVGPRWIGPDNEHLRLANPAIPSAKAATPAWAAFSASWRSSGVRRECCGCPTGRRTSSFP